MDGRAAGSGVRPRGTRGTGPLCLRCFSHHAASTLRPSAHCLALAARTDMQSTYWAGELHHTPVPSMRRVHDEAR